MKDIRRLSVEFLTNDLIQTSFLVKTEWDKGFTGIIELTNTGENITEWTIEFESQFEIYPEQIWGAEIVNREGDRYTLKPVDYNETIYANQGTSIIFNGNKINGEIFRPQNIRLATERIVTPVSENPGKLGDEVMATVREETQANTADLFPYQIKTNFVVETQWDKGFTARLDLLNTGDVLENWTIEFISPYEIDPKQLWGAEILKQEGDRYLLKAPDYNQNLDSQETASITFNAPKMYGSTLRPQEIKVGNSLEFSDDDSDLPQVNQEILATLPLRTELATTPENDLSVDVDFTLISDWGDGFQGAISITNNSGSNIDTWSLDFDFPNSINNIWDAEIEYNQNGSYIVTNAAWNREIPAGETITFGFTGNDSVTSQPKNFELDGFTFDSPSIYKTIYTYQNPNLAPELELNQVYQGRATFYDAANPAGGIGASGFDIPIQSELHKIVAMNNIQWNGSQASGAFMKVSGPKQREGAAPIIVQVADHLMERADGMDMSAEAFAKVANPIDGTVNIEYQLIGPGDDYVTANGYSIGQGIVVETITGTNPYYAATRLNNHRYPIKTVELIEEDGDLLELNRESDNRFVMEGNYPLYGVQDLLVTDIFGQQVTLDDIDITNSSAPDKITGEQFALI